VIEKLTDGTQIRGIMIPPHGTHAGLERCALANPPMGTMYIASTDRDGQQTASLYLWLEPSFTGPAEDFGWVQVFDPTLAPFTGVAHDATLTGNGLAINQMSVKSLKVYDSQLTYAQGDMVYGTIEFGSRIATGVFIRRGASWHPVALDTPVGSMIQFIWTRVDHTQDPPVPPGYLRCEHELCDKTLYADLFAVIGERFNEGGDPSDMFRVPDIDNTIIYSGIMA
jgi:hypothetical protein